MLDLTQTLKTQSPSLAPVGDACLVFIYPTGPQMGTRYVLKDAEVFIGRTDDCKVRNTDASVSRTHARIDRRPDGYVVNDLGSTNGTFVNNALVKLAKLDDGDYLRIGNCIYRFLAGGNLEAEYHEEIYRLTVLDGLTGVHNRRYLLEFLDRELARSERHARPLALALFDIDHFKKINDTNGHLAGDMVLRQMAGLVKGAVRKDELLARYGGEEFALVLPEADPVRAVQACERVRQVIERHDFVHDGAKIPVTVSGGLATTISGAVGTVEDLFAIADRKLYEAKAGGRNRLSY